MYTAFVNVLACILHLRFSEIVPPRPGGGGSKDFPWGDLPSKTISWGGAGTPPRGWGIFEACAGGVRFYSGVHAAVRLVLLRGRKPYCCLTRR